MQNYLYSKVMINLNKDQSLFDSHYPYEHKQIGSDPEVHEYNFFTSNNDKFNVDINHDPFEEKKAEVAFFGNGENFNTSNTGLHPKDAHKVFGTVKHIIQHHAKKHGINQYTFDAEKSKERGSRSSIYSKMAKGHDVKVTPLHTNYKTPFSTVTINMNKDHSGEKMITLQQFTFKDVNKDHSLFDSHYPFKKEKLLKNEQDSRYEHHKYSFKTPNNNYEVHMYHFKDAPHKKIGVEFHDNHENVHNTGLHPKDAHKVFGTVKHIMQQHAKEHGINQYTFDAEKSKERGSRSSIYAKMAKGHENTVENHLFRAGSTITVNVNKDHSGENKMITLQQFVFKDKADNPNTPAKLQNPPKIDRNGEIFWAELTATLQREMYKPIVQTFNTTGGTISTYGYIFTSLAEDLISHPKIRSIDNVMDANIPASETLHLAKSIAEWMRQTYPQILDMHVTRINEKGEPLVIKDYHDEFVQAFQEFCESLLSQGEGSQSQQDQGYFKYKDLEDIARIECEQLYHEGSMSAKRYIKRRYNLLSMVRNHYDDVDKIIDIASSLQFNPKGENSFISRYIPQSGNSYYEQRAKLIAKSSRQQYKPWSQPQLYLLAPEESKIKQVRSLVPPLSILDKGTYVYLQANLISAQNFLTWLRAHGITNTVPATDIHITLVYSDKIKPFQRADHGRLFINPQDCKFALFGPNKDVLVILTNSKYIKLRVMYLRRQAGLTPPYASPFQIFLQHITVATNWRKGIGGLPNLSEYPGMILFDREITEPLDKDTK